jgi:hypothetical protein
MRKTVQYQKTAGAGMTPAARWFIRSASGLKPDRRDMPVRIAGHVSPSRRALHGGAACDVPAVAAALGP